MWLPAAAFRKGPDNSAIEKYMDYCRNSGFFSLLHPIPAHSSRYRKIAIYKFWYVVEQKILYKTCFFLKNLKLCFFFYVCLKSSFHYIYTIFQKNWKDKHAFKSPGYDKSNKHESIKFYLERAKLQVCKERHVKGQFGKFRHFEEV